MGIGEDVEAQELVDSAALLGAEGFKPLGNHPRVALQESVAIALQRLHLFFTALQGLQLAPGGLAVPSSAARCVPVTVATLGRWKG